jgi:hypothetical protein
MALANGTDVKLLPRGSTNRDGARLHEKTLSI